RGFSEALARELMDTNVSVRYFAPRGTRTALNDDRVVAMNAELGNAMDTPEQVAAQLVAFLSQDGRSRFLGWPEKLYVLVNALLPSIVDRSVRQQLSTIKRYF